MTYADIELQNRFTGATVVVRALVDTGAVFLCVPDRVARALGFDPDEVSRARVTLADGRIAEVPRIDPVRVALHGRSYSTEALVLGDEPLLGALPLEAMDLVVDPRRQAVMPNPAHPDGPVSLIKATPERARSTAPPRATPARLVATPHP